MNKEIERINALAKISKERELTEEESLEQKELRNNYVKKFRENFHQTLLNTKIIDERGQDVTPKKLKSEREKRERK